MSDWLIGECGWGLPGHVGEIEHVEKIVRCSVAARETGQAESGFDKFQDGGMVGDGVRYIVLLHPGRDDDEGDAETIPVECTLHIGGTEVHGS